MLQSKPTSKNCKNINNSKVKGEMLEIQCMVCVCVCTCMCVCVDRGSVQLAGCENIEQRVVASKTAVSLTTSIFEPAAATCTEMPMAALQ